MKNNKGMTLVEIIISIALISIVLLFLFMLLVTVNDINQESEVNSTYLVNKALILKNIEEELSKTESIYLSSCNVKTDIYTNYGNGTTYFTYEDNDTSRTDLNKLKAKECLKINYNDGTPDAKIGIYYYKKQNSYVISYIHDNIKATRLLPEFEKYNVNSDGDFDDNFKMKYINANGAIKYYSDLGTASTSTSGFHQIKIPIIGTDEKDYTIIISYRGTVTIR